MDLGERANRFRFLIRDRAAGSRHLRTVLDEYAVHYNQRRPHRARNLRPPDYDDSATSPVIDLVTARIRRKKILGGLIHEYQRAA
jgi:hypothetical protein